MSDRSITIEVIDPSSEPGSRLAPELASEALAFDEWETRRRGRVILLRRPFRRLWRFLAQRRLDRTPARTARVRHHLRDSPGRVIRLPKPGSSFAAGEAVLTITDRFRAAPRGALRAPATMRLPWSVSPMRVGVEIEPWWRGGTVVSIWLGRRRGSWRPRRFFAAAHGCLDEFESAIVDHRRPTDQPESSNRQNGWPSGSSITVTSSWG